MILRLHGYITNPIKIFEINMNFKYFRIVNILNIILVKYI